MWIFRCLTLKIRFFLLYLVGLGSVYGPYKHLAYFLRNIEETELLTLKRRLLQTMERLLVRKKRLILAKKELRRVNGYRFVEQTGGKNEEKKIKFVIQINYSKFITDNSK